MNYIKVHSIDDEEMKFFDIFQCDQYFRLSCLLGNNTLLSIRVRAQRIHWTNIIRSVSHQVLSIYRKIWVKSIIHLHYQEILVSSTILLFFNRKKIRTMVKRRETHFHAYSVSWRSSVKRSWKFCSFTNKLMEISNEFAICNLFSLEAFSKFLFSRWQVRSKRNDSSNRE